MTDIETKIREQKNKIKEDQRELSRLQEETRHNNDPLRVRLEEMEYGDLTTIRVSSNRRIPSDRIRRAVESMSDKPSEPKSYVDWDKIDKGYDWAVVRRSDRNHVDGCPVAVYKNMPVIKDGEWANVMGDIENMGEWATWGKLIVGILPVWDKSLVHRPGIKE